MEGFAARAGAQQAADRAQPKGAPAAPVTPAAAPPANGAPGSATPGNAMPPGNATPPADTARPGNAASGDAAPANAAPGSAAATLPPLPSIQPTPPTALAQSALAEAAALAKAGMWPDALQAANRAIAQSPGWAEAYHARASIYIGMAKPDAALNADKPAANVDFGALKSSITAAREDMRQAIALAPASKEQLQPELDRIQHWLGEIDKAPARIYEKSCRAGDAGACESAATMLLQHNDGERAAALLARACKGNRADACLKAAGLYTGGGGVAKNGAEAVSLFESACRLNRAEGCVRAAAAYARGDGVARSPTQALGLYRAGCTLGDQRACAEVAPLERAAREQEAAARAEAARAAREREQQAHAHPTLAMRIAGGTLLGGGLLCAGLTGVYAFLEQDARHQVDRGGFATANDIAAAGRRVQSYRTDTIALGVLGGLAIAASIPLIHFGRKWRAETVRVSASANDVFVAAAGRF